MTDPKQDNQCIVCKKDKGTTKPSSFCSGTCEMDYNLCNNGWEGC